MRIVVCVLGLSLVVALTQAQHNPPTVNIYTEKPVEFGEKNRLICYCSGFHPPRIEMTLKKDGVEFKDCTDSDLSFKQDWTYHKMTHTEFIPKEGEKYECTVKHDEGKPKNYMLEIL